MTRLRIKEAIAEETAVKANRSSPRRRKREASEGLHDTETLSPTTKEANTRATKRLKSGSETKAQATDSRKAQTIVNGDGRAGPKPRPRATAPRIEIEEARAQRVGLETGKEIVNSPSAEPPSKRVKLKATTKKAKRIEEQDSVVEEDNRTFDSDTTKTPKRRRKESTSRKPIPHQDPERDDSANSVDESTPKKAKRKRKTAEEKAAEAMPLAARTTGLRMYVGAHVSIAKGIQNSITNIHHVGGNAFALFLKSQRKWDNPALTDSNRDAFHSHCHTHRYDASSHIVPHGSYLVNLAQADAERSAQSYTTFLDDLHRCESLGIKLYNFHPGATGSSPLPDAIKRIATHLNTALRCTTTVTPLLENMAGSGTVIGSRFSDLRDIISHIEPEFQSRIGVCLDTCHTFAAGYDLRTPDSFAQVLDDFDRVVGLRYLKALHLNDSKAPLGSKKDLHQNIGLGFLGLRTFHNVMNERRFEGLPLILETPCERPDPEDESGKKTVEDKGVWATEIKLLERLIGMDAESEEFVGLERELAERGRVEREKMLQGLQERERKRKAKEEKEKEKGQRSLLDMMDGAVAKTKGKPKPRGNEKGKRNTLKAKRKGKDESHGSGTESGDSLDSDLASLLNEARER